MLRILAVCCLLSVARGDQIVLRSGGRLSGEILHEDESSVHVRMPHGTMTIPRARIREIVRETQVEYLRREAASSLRTGATETAVELYRKALAHDPGDAATQRDYMGALVAHARALREGFRLAKAYATLEKVLELDPRHADARALMEQLKRDEDDAVRMHNRALEALKKGDVERALLWFEAWRLRRPVGDELARDRLATAHLAAGKAELEGGRYLQALTHFRTAASFGAEKETREILWVLEPIGVLESLGEGELQRAYGAIYKLSADYPDKSVPVYLYGVYYHLVGEVDKAVKHYAAAARLAQKGPVEGTLPYEVVRKYATAILRSAVARPPREGTRRWREVFLKPLRRSDESTYFTVYAPTEQQAESLGRLADEHYETIAEELLGKAPSARKAELVVHPNRAAYIAADPIPPNSPLSAAAVPRASTAGVTYASLDENGKLIVRIEMYADDTLAGDTLPHEVAHVVQRRGVRVHRRGHWLDEGIAMLFESSGGRERRITGLKGTQLFPLAELVAFRSTPTNRGGHFYAQSYALTAYLRGLGSDKDWRAFLDAYAAGDFANAVRKIYSVASADDLERDFLRWLNRQ